MAILDVRLAVERPFVVRQWASLSTSKAAGLIAAVVMMVTACTGEVIDPLSSVEESPGGFGTCDAAEAPVIGTMTASPESTGSSRQLSGRANLSQLILVEPSEQFPGPS